MSKIKFSERLRSLFRLSRIEPSFWENLEEILLSSDAGLAVTEAVVASARGAKGVSEARDCVHAALQERLLSYRISLREKPHVIMVVGVNGSGKTTTIAKLAHRFQKEGKKVLLAAGDTFRAAAADQLQIWGDRLKIPVVAGPHNADPASIAFDGVRQGSTKGYDIVLLDTAGRLHTDKNLMAELQKVKRVTGKALAGAPHDIFLVLDAAVGQNGMAQARQFHEALGLTSVIVAKMDGTAKGGIILSIAHDLALPISYVGVGETIDDLEPFDPPQFVKNLLE